MTRYGSVRGALSNRRPCRDSDRVVLQKATSRNYKSKPRTGYCLPEALWGAACPRQVSHPRQNYVPKLTCRCSLLQAAHRCR